jgi:hypothetical protein
MKEKRILLSVAATYPSLTSYKAFITPALDASALGTTYITQRVPSLMKQISFPESLLMKGRGSFNQGLEAALGPSSAPSSLPKTKVSE